MRFTANCDVRFGSKADTHPPTADVRFTPKSGHWSWWPEGRQAVRQGDLHLQKTSVSAGRNEDARFEF